MKKRVISLFLCLAVVLTCLPSLFVTPALAADAWNGTAAAGYAGGSGTRNDPYLIATPGQLALFRDQVNGGSSGICAKVVADLDLNNKSWTPIGLNQTGYTGIFDGGGWAIKNMRLDRLSDPVRFMQPNGKDGPWTVAGLFGIVGTSGAVKYVNVDGEVTGSVSSSNATYVGGVAGLSVGTVEECFTTCNFTNFSVSASNYIGIGGIVGFTFEGSVVKNCYYIGSMNLTLKQLTSGLNHYVGGIVGYAIDEVSNCYSVCRATVSSNASRYFAKGAIAGMAWYDTNVKNCYFDNQVCTWTSYAVGGGYSHGRSPFNPAGCSGQSTENMKSWWIPDTLGNAYRYDFDGVNDGYPVLAVMTYGETAKEDPWYTEELKSYGVTEEELGALVPVALWNKDVTKCVTRAEFAAVAVNLYELLSGENVTVEVANPFTDTSNDDIIKAYQLGITNGTSATTFTPYKNISRQDMATMLTRVYKKLYIPGWTPATDGSFRLDYTMPELFLDNARIASYARDSVYYMASQDILKGSNGYFHPYAATDRDTVGNATREQAIITSIRYYFANK